MKTRQCNSCTACCEGWIDATIVDVKVYPGNPCMHCTNSGCGIYENRPKSPCRTFQCGWLKPDSPLPEDMKPTNCGAIIMFDRKWNGLAVVYALPVGEKIPESTLQWLMNHSKKHSIPLIFFENTMKDGKFSVKKQFGFGPQAFVHAISKAINAEDVFML